MADTDPLTDNSETNAYEQIDQTPQIARNPMSTMLKFIGRQKFFFKKFKFASRKRTRARANELDLHAHFQNYKFEDANMSNLLLDRILLIDRGILSLAFMSIGLSIREYDLEFNFQPTDQVNVEMINNILVIIGWINIMMVIINILRYVLRNRFKIIKMEKPPGTTLWESGRMPFIITESLFILIGPCHWFIGKKFFTYNRIIAEEIYYMYNDILHVIQLYKIWLIARSILQNSRYASNRSHRICQMYDTKSTTGWVIRSYMRTMPFTFVFQIFIIGILMFAYALRIAESPLTRKVIFISSSLFSNI